MCFALRFVFLYEFEARHGTQQNNRSRFRHILTKIVLFVVTRVVWSQINRATERSRSCSATHNGRTEKHDQGGR